MPFAAIHDCLGEDGLRINPVHGSPIRVRYFVAEAATQPVATVGKAFVEILKSELDLLSSKWEQLSAPIEN